LFSSSLKSLLRICGKNKIRKSASYHMTSQCTQTYSPDGPDVTEDERFDFAPYLTLSNSPNQITKSNS
jgi:hypothetical protein